MYDRWNRKIDYMRISVTDRCNLRCRYCMPEKIDLVPMGEILRYEEILEVCREAVDLGITRFKITGGEPLVRLGCTDLICRLKKMDGVDQVTLTTNGILLYEKIEALKDAGIDGINISLDTLDPVKYEAITGYHGLDKVMRSIHASLNAGLKIKINSVLLPGENEEDWEDLLGLARDLPLDVRFIELMPIGFGKGRSCFSNDQLMERIRNRYPGITPDPGRHGNGPAVYYRIPGFNGSLGLISAVHGRFCSSCNRIRLTSTGDLKPCLCYEDRISVKDAVRAGDRDKVRTLLRSAVDAKPRMHHFEEDRAVTESRKMVQIGG